MNKQGLGRGQVHDAAWKRENYPHPLISCLMPVAAFLGVIVLGIIGFTFWENTLPGDVNVPGEVVGVPQAQAVGVLTQAGLKVEIIKQRTPSETVPRGSVVSTRPEAGRRVKQGRTVFLQISDGSVYSAVPNIVNISQQQARVMVANAGLRVQRESFVYDEIIPIDRIISVNPKPGTKCLKGGVVDIVISKGDKAIEEAGFEGETDLNTSILSFELPYDEPGTAEVRIEVSDDTGVRTVYQETHDPGDTVVFTVEGTGPTIAKVYFGNRLILTRKF